jgi:DUF1365 family protein
MFYLDLDEIETLVDSKWYWSLNKFNLLSFHRKDYFKPEEPDLKQAVTNAVSEFFRSNELDIPEIKRVAVLSHLRLFNWVFNPVSFYYCYDSATPSDNDQPVAILAEITNTPWNERHSYVLPMTKQAIESPALHEEITPSIKSNRNFYFEFDKVFHVSPFNPMNMRYQWLFSNASESLKVHMNNLMYDNHQTKHFDATLKLEASNIQKTLTKTLIRFPLMTVKVVTGIYWQALKLWLKKAPFYDHPNCRDEEVKPNKIKDSSANSTGNTSSTLSTADNS